VGGRLTSAGAAPAGGAVRDQVIELASAELAPVLEVEQGAESLHRRRFSRCRRPPGADPPAMPSLPDATP
jgi:hypothetical protein